MHVTYSLPGETFILRLPINLEIVHFMEKVNM